MERIVSRRTMHNNNTAEYTSDRIIPPEEVGMSDMMLENIDRLVAQQLHGKLYKGIVVLIARHGTICYFRAFGDADEDTPMQTDAIFRLASMTKAVTAAAVMQLHDQGRIALSEPISCYIPEFKDLNVADLDQHGDVRLVPAKREITIHHLLSLTSGLSGTYQSDTSDPVHHYIAQVYADAGVQDCLSSCDDTTIAANAQRAATLPLVGHPGEVWEYGNLNLDVLAYLVEQLSGMAFDRYCAEHIFMPLQMRETWFYPPQECFSRIPAIFNTPGTLEKMTADQPLGLGFVGPQYTFGQRTSHPSPSGGLHGTTADWFRFAQMLLNHGELDGVRILSRQAIELMTTNQIGDSLVDTLTQNKWGYMVDIQEDVTAPLVYNGGKGAYTWRGFWGTEWFAHPKHDMVVICMTQMGFDEALPCLWKINTAAGAAVLD
jgi:CubicO group peptidase (beta-lactamase class C family)